jgi:hypothetical protein
MAGSVRSGFAVALVSFATAACNAAAHGEEDLHSRRLGQIEALSRLCGLPQGVLTFMEPDKVLLRGPIEEVPFSAVRCALDRSEEAGIPRHKIAFAAAPSPGRSN